MGLAREAELKYMQDEDSFTTVFHVVSVGGGHFKQHLDLDAQPEWEIGQAQQDAAGPGDAAFYCGRVLIKTDPFHGHQLADLEGAFFRGRGGNDAGAGDQAAGHLFDRFCYDPVYFFRDIAVHFVLHALGHPVDQ